MKRKRFSDMACSVARTVDVIGEWWTTLILREAFLGVRRFDEMQRNLGIARNILSSRLSRLVEHGILERCLYQKRPQRFEYRLTDKGRDLYPIVIALMNWGDKWAAGDEGVPMILRHRDCGEQMQPTFVCSACGAELDPRHVEAQPGPGAPPDLCEKYPRMHVETVPAARRPRPTGPGQRVVSYPGRN